MYLDEQDLGKINDFINEYLYARCESDDTEMLCIANDLIEFLADKIME